MNNKAQEWLLQRLIQFGADVYISGKFSSLHERLAHVIKENRLESTVAGRREGEAVTYRKVLEMSK
jgi:hypothetical protein